MLVLARLPFSFLPRPEPRRALTRDRWLLGYPTSANGSSRVYMGSNRFRFDMPKYVDFYVDGRLRLDEMISARIPLADVNKRVRPDVQGRGGAAGDRGLPSFVAVALLWKTLGTSIWLLNAVTGASWIATSPLVHLLCPLLAFLAAREQPPRACAAPALNVNAAFTVRAGWEAHFPRHDVFAALVFGGGAGVFFLADRLYARGIEAPVRRRRHGTR